MMEKLILHLFLHMKKLRHREYKVTQLMADWDFSYLVQKEKYAFSLPCVRPPPGLQLTALRIYTGFKGSPLQTRHEED